MRYFRHDIGARHDLKMQNLLMTYGATGWGIYWAIVETMYENNGVLPVSQCKSIAFALQTKESIVENIVADFGLFIKDDNGNFTSERVQREIASLNKVSESRKHSAFARWHKIETSLFKEINAPKVEVKNSPANSGGASSSRRTKKELDLSFIPDEWLGVVNQWLSYKKERKESYVQVGVKAFFDKLVKLSGGNIQKAEAIIKQSFANNWAGIFNLKEENGNKNGNRKTDSSLSVSDFAEVQSSL